MTDASWPELDEHSLGDWLAALGDNELSGAQRKTLLQYVESHPQHWRACALALWDAQVLGKQVVAAIPTAVYELQTHPVPVEPNASRLRSQDTTSSIVATTPTSESSRSRFGRWQWRVTSATSLLAVTCAILLGTVVGSWWMVANRAATVATLEQELSVSHEYIEQLAGTILAERSTFRNLAGVFPDRPCLIEIENTGDRVVYLADGPVPEDLLRGLVNMGQVRVQPYQPDFETPLWKSLDRPIVAIEVDKFSSLLLAQGESL
jgi:hypothetical protein